MHIQKTGDQECFLVEELRYFKKNGNIIKRKGRINSKNHALSIFG